MHYCSLLTLDKLKEDVGLWQDVCTGSSLKRMSAARISRILAISKNHRFFNHRHHFIELVAMLSSVPARLIVRRSRSLSPSTRVFQTSVNAPTCHGIRETQVDINRNTVVSTSCVSKRGIQDGKTACANVNSLVQYHHLAPKWLSKLENRRRSWAALASRGRSKNQYWDESHGTSRAGLASVGLLSAAAVAFCLNKDSDNKGRQSLSCYCLTCYYKKIRKNNNKLSSYGST